MALSKTTQDHDEIRQWAEARGGKPADVASTETNGQTGIIRIEFPGAVHANDSALKEISWDEFFEKFDASGLALVYQEQTAEGATSNFNKLVHPEKVSASAKKSAKKAPAKKSANASAPVKKSVVVREAVAVKKPVPAKKATSAVKKSATKSAAAKKSVPAKKSAAKSASAKSSTAKTMTAKSSAKTVSAKKAAVKKSAGVKRLKR